MRFCKKLISYIPRWESHISFWDWVYRGVVLILSVGGAVWTAATAWVEGAVGQWGTLGYVAVFLAVLLCLALFFVLLSWGAFAVAWIRRSRSVSQPGSPGITEAAQDADIATDKLPDAVRREFANFVVAEIGPNRRPCASMFAKLVKELCLSKDRTRRYLGSAISGGALSRERDAWESLNKALTEAQSICDLEHSFYTYYKSFISLSSWILRAAQSLERLDSLRKSTDFLEVATAHNQLLSDARDFAALRPGLRDALQKWAYLDMNTHIPE